MKILVLRLREIGDSLLSLAVCSTLKSIYPDATVDYLVYEHIAPLLEKYPDIDCVQTISKKERGNPLLMIKKILKLRKEGYDICLDLITLPISALICYFSGAEKTIGFDHKNRSFLYKIQVPHPKHTNEIKAKLSVLTGLGVSPQNYLTRYRIIVSEKEQHLARTLLQEAGVDLTRPVFVVAATSSTEKKYWPAEYFSELLSHCQQKYNAQLIFNSMPGVEQEFVSKVVAQLTDKTSVYDNINLSLKQLAAVIKLSDFLIGNDGGPNHIAVATGTPSLVVFSPFQYKYLWLPENDPEHLGVDLIDALGITDMQHHVMRWEINHDIPGYYKKITPAMVITALDKMLVSIGFTAIKPK